MKAKVSQAAIAALALAAIASYPQQTAAPSPTSQSSDASARNAKVRIARLSEVRGDVALDRNTGGGFQKALNHTPIVEQSRLQTGFGRAEVEFEDNSTLRLAPYSLVEFPRLELLPSGAKASTVRVVKGTAYVSLMPAYVVKTKGNDFLLTFDQQKIHLYPSNHIRLELDGTEARLAVFEGTGQIEGPSSTTKFARKKTFNFNLLSQSEPAVARKVRTAPLDTWDSWAAEYHKRNASMGYSPNMGSDAKTSPGMLHDIFR